MRAAYPQVALPTGGRCGSRKAGHLPGVTVSAPDPAGTRPPAAPGPGGPPAAPERPDGPLRVLRLASVFPVPCGLLGRVGAFDPVGGMQNHTGQLSAELDRLGVA